MGFGLIYGSAARLSFQAGILLIIILSLYLCVKYSAIDAEMLSFIVFAGIAAAGLLIFKAAKAAADDFEARVQKVYETIEADISDSGKYIMFNAAINSNSLFEKYTASKAA